MKTEYANMMHGVRKPLLTTSRHDTMVVRTPKMIVTELKNAPRVQSE
jgi:hypothetical protein